MTAIRLMTSSNRRLTRLSFGLVSTASSWRSDHRAASALLMAAIASSPSKASPRLSLASFTASWVSLDHSIARRRRAANAPVVARICASASRLAGV